MSALMVTLLVVTVACLSPLAVVTVRTVRLDTRLNADLGRKWRRRGARPVSAVSERRVEA